MKRNPSRRLCKRLRSLIEEYSRCCVAQSWAGMHAAEDNVALIEEEQKAATEAVAAELGVLEALIVKVFDAGYESVGTDTSDADYIDARDRTIARLTEELRRARKTS